MTAPLDKFANQLDWNLLRTFMVIVQERSITLAAHRLSVTQPSVSAALRRLEERLERRLIERGGAAAFQPTPAGEVLYRHCADIYGVVTALPSALDAAHAEVQGIVTLHLSGHIHWPELPGLIAAYRQDYPLVRFRFRRGTCDEILGQLAQKNAVLGVVSAHDARPVLVQRKLFDQEMSHYVRAPAPAEDPARRAGAGLRGRTGGLAPGRAVHAPHPRGPGRPHRGGRARLHGAGRPGARRRRHRRAAAPPGGRGRQPGRTAARPAGPAGLSGAP
jgi:DNA-binding transcriptional LysR family regulator